jgi:hypothetical protein
MSVELSWRRLELRAAGPHARERRPPGRNTDGAKARLLGDRASRAQPLGADETHVEDAAAQHAAQARREVRGRGARPH